MPHVIGLTIGRATSSSSDDVPAKDVPFTINISFHCRCQANWMAKKNHIPMFFIFQLNLIHMQLQLHKPRYQYSALLNLILIGSSLSNLFQFAPRSRRPAQDQMGDETSAGHKALTWMEDVSSVTSANSNTQDLRNQQRNDSVLYNLYMYRKIYLQIVLQIISNHTAHLKHLRLLPITLETFLYLLLWPFCNLPPLPFWFRKPIR